MSIPQEWRPQWARCETCTLTSTYSTTHHIYCTFMQYLHTSNLPAKCVVEITITSIISSTQLKGERGYKKLLLQCQTGKWEYDVITKSQAYCQLCSSPHIYITHTQPAHTAREAMRTMWKFSFCKQIEIKAKHAKKKRKTETGSDTKWYRQYCTEQI